MGKSEVGGKRLRNKTRRTKRIIRNKKNQFNKQFKEH
jgi:hypothetical protein